LDFARLVEFIGNHPILILAFFGTLGFLIVSEIRHRMSGIAGIGPVQATQLSNRENAVFLDIRESKEIKSGRIPDAVHVPLSQLPDRVAELDKYKDVPLITYCRSGSRSDRAGAILKKHGFEKVYNLGGGMMAWEKANLPVRKK